MPTTDMSLEQTQEAFLPPQTQASPHCVTRSPALPTPSRRPSTPANTWPLLQNKLKPRYEVSAEEAGAAGGEVTVWGASRVSLPIQKLRDSF